MTSIDLQVSNFEKSGKFDYQFDDHGNVIISNVSDNFYNHYLAVPLTIINYDNEKVNEFIDVNFSEFIISNPSDIIMNGMNNKDGELILDSTMQTELNNAINNVMEENKSLKSQLDTILQRVNDQITDAEKLAVKQVILELRKKLGEGASDEDFLEEFPYTPIVLTQLNKK